MNRNEKIDNQLAEIGLMSSRHAELIRHRRFKIIGEIIMILIVGCGTALMILGIINQQIALAFAGATIAILATMQGYTFTNEKFGLDSEIKHLEDEIDDKIAVTMAEITKDINEMTQKFIEELKNNREKAEQDALKCSLKGKNTKNNAQKAKNKTKSVAKTTKKEK